MCLSSLLVVRSVLEPSDEARAVPFGVLLNGNLSPLAIRQADDENRELAIPFEGHHGRANEAAIELAEEDGLLAFRPTRTLLVHPSSFLAEAFRSTPSRALVARQVKAEVQQ
jgi:hypothetical protein